MIPVLPPCRCYEEFKKCSNCDCSLIQKMFKLQQDYDIRAMTLQEIQKLVKEMDAEEN